MANQIETVQQPHPSQQSQYFIPMAVDYNTYLKWVESQQNGAGSLQAQQVVQLFKNRDSGPSAAAKPSDGLEDVDQIVNASVVQPETTERRTVLRVSNSPKHSVSSDSSKFLFY